MKCPKCKSKLSKKYSYCYDCGFNVSKKRINDNVKDSLGLGVFLLLVVLVYPAQKYFTNSDELASLKSAINYNPNVTLVCEKAFDSYYATLTMDYNAKKLTGYNIKYKYKETVNNSVKENLSKFKNETGIDYDTTDTLVDYSVSVKSVVNDRIYDLNKEIKYDLDESYSSFINSGYTCYTK